MKPQWLDVLFGFALGVLTAAIGGSVLDYVAAQRDLTEANAIRIQIVPAPTPTCVEAEVVRGVVEGVVVKGGR